MDKPIMDISHHQTVTDWTKTAGAVEAAYIKATEGQGYMDPKFREFTQAAQSHGIPKGFYHYASLNDTANPATDARAEARGFLKATAPYTKELPYALDIETNKSGLDRGQVVQWIAAFFDELEQNGVKDYVIYSYTPFLDDNLPKDHPFGKIRLWLAAYTETPKLPKGWAAYWLWQYTDRGSVPGIAGKVDLSRKPS